MTVALAVPLWLILNILYLWPPALFEMLPFLGSSNILLPWIVSSGLSSDSFTAFSSFSHFLSRGRSPHLVVGPLLIIHFIVFTTVLQALNFS